jgi:hypothetical protein
MNEARNTNRKKERDKNVSPKPERKILFVIHRLKWDDNIRWTLER